MISRLPLPVCRGAGSGRRAGALSATSAGGHTIAALRSGTRAALDTPVARSTRRSPTILPDHVALIRGSEEFAYVFLALVRDSLVGGSAPGLRVILRIRRLIENGEHARRVCFVGVVVHEGSRLDRPGLLLGRRDLGRPGGRTAMAERPFAGLALERSLRATTATCPTTGVLSARSSRPFPTGCRGAGARRRPSRERPAHHCGDACSPQTERK